MYKIISILLLVILFGACSKTKFESHDHSAGGHETHGHEAEGIENNKYTILSERYELFAEVTPFIKDNEVKFTIHYTKLSDFKPVINGTLKIELNGEINETLLVDSISRPGIFISNYTPQSTGNFDITFIYSNELESEHDTIKVKSQTCFATLEEAERVIKHDEKGITFLKEESWKIDFSLFQVKSTNFIETIKASGKVINNPANETIIAATASGVIDFADESIIQGKKVSAGNKLFSIKPGSMREDNTELKYQQAKSNYEKEKRNYERVMELYKSKISTETEYLEEKSHFETAEALLRNYSLSSEGKSAVLKAAKNGYLSKLLVTQGQFVEAGSPVAVISNNNKMLIQVELPTAEYHKITNTNNANLIINNITVSLKELNGKFIGNPINSGSSAFVTLYIQIDNKLNLQPNSYYTIYLFGDNIPNSIVIPKESVWEDQVNYFVFVQKNGELFEKREIIIQGYDGLNYLISSGLNQGEVIVNKGTYRVMLASKSSELPANSHAH